MKNIFLIILFLATSQLSAQYIKVVRQADTIPTEKPVTFEYVTVKTEYSKLLYIATLNFVGNRLDNYFAALAKKANELGANAYRIVDYKKKEDSQQELTIDVFYATDDVLDANYMDYDKNVIYVMGNINKPEKFKINGQKILLKEGEVYRYDLKPEEEVKINKGGFTGMTVYYNWQENQPAKFISFDGFGVGSGTVGVAAGSGFSGTQAGISFTTGYINELEESNYNYFLVQLSKRE